MKKLIITAFLLLNMQVLFAQKYIEVSVTPIGYDVLDIGSTFGSFASPIKIGLLEFTSVNQFFNLALYYKSRENANYDLDRWSYNTKMEVGSKTYGITIARNYLLAGELDETNYFYTITGIDIAYKKYTYKLKQEFDNSYEERKFWDDFPILQDGSLIKYDGVLGLGYQLNFSNKIGWYNDLKVHFGFTTVKDELSFGGYFESGLRVKLK